MVTLTHPGPYTDRRADAFSTALPPLAILPDSASIVCDPGALSAACMRGVGLRRLSKLRLAHGELSVTPITPDGSTGSTNQPSVAQTESRDHRPA